LARWGLARFSGIYYIEAQKTVSSVTPLKVHAAVAMHNVKVRPIQASATCEESK
jgi:hypothetical protein